MGTREQLLALLEEQRGVYFSGEELARRLSVSRTAVWKAVKSLRDGGYPIDAVQNKGYCLSEETDILSAEGIRKYLNPTGMAIELDWRACVTSTNTVAREKAAAGAPEGYTVIAGAQTQGRGRSGRTFYSPSDTGVYLSILLRPVNWSPQQAVRLTTMAAVAACEAIEAVSGKPAGIKWVNDIFMDGKKVSGILTEAAVGLETGCLEYAVLGIGFNAIPPREGFPDELQSIAGTIFDGPQGDGKNRLAAAFLNAFTGYYAQPREAYTAAYRSRSLALGREVQVLFPGGTKKAVALDVDEECRLLVQYEDGRKETLSSGEIRVRLS